MINLLSGITFPIFGKTNTWRYLLPLTFIKRFVKTETYNNVLYVSGEKSAKIDQEMTKLRRFVQLKLASFLNLGVLRGIFKLMALLFPDLSGS